MDCGGVSSSQSNKDDPEGSGGGKDRSAPFRAYTELFNREFPYYLAMGMTYDQFWKDDPELVVAYRKAEKLRRNQANENAWLNGLYFYHALIDIAPVLIPFSKANGPEPYFSKPIDFDAEPEDPEKLQMEKDKAQMEQWMASINAEFKKKKEVD